MRNFSVRGTAFALSRGSHLIVEGYRAASDKPWFASGRLQYLSGPALEYPWIASGPVLEYPWIASGPVLEYPWIASGPALENPWFASGRQHKALDQSWITPVFPLDAGKKALDQPWIPSGVQHWTTFGVQLWSSDQICTGPALDQHWTPLDKTPLDSLDASAGPVLAQSWSAVRVGSFRRKGKKDGWDGGKEK